MHFVLLSDLKWLLKTPTCDKHTSYHAKHTHTNVCVLVLSLFFFSCGVKRNVDDYNDNDDDDDGV